MLQTIHYNDNDMRDEPMVMPISTTPTPKEIVAELDKYIICQT